jgi:hypothetical protein
MIDVWGEKLDDQMLSDREKKYLESLPDEVPTVQWVWSEMDRIWDDCGLNNRAPFSSQDIGGFYGHPVWIMNGLFTETDSESACHRESIGRFLCKNTIANIADYGGGSGCLAATITKKYPEVKIDIIEPYASEFFKNKRSDSDNIGFFPHYQHRNYDAVIAQDVLEHVENPIEIAFQMASHVDDGSLVVFANCFDSCIKCHLPGTFYLRYTFKWVMKELGLVYVGRVD